MSLEITPSSDLAEICGIHAGDGYLRNKNYKRELDISGSPEEQPYYDNHMAPLFSRVFGVEPKCRLFPSRGTYGFVIRDKRVVEKMHELGFPYGKKSLIVRAPTFVMETEDPKIKAAFLRGIFDTDGCLTFNRRVCGKYCIFKKTHNYYPVIDIASISKDLISDLRVLLSTLGIHYCHRTYIHKKENEHISYTLYVRGNYFLTEWMASIGSNNPIQLSRYWIWKKYGHCPSHTTFKERLLILSGDISLDYGPVV